MPQFKMTIALLAFLSVAGFVGASESDEIRDRVEAMRREAAELAEHGNHDEAAKLERRADSMLKEVERLEPRRPDRRNRELAELKRRLEEIRQRERELVESDGPHEQIAELREEMQRIEEESQRQMHGPDKPHDRQNEMARRLEHMHIAVEHLNHAGLRDIAEHVSQRAEATEREMHDGNRSHMDEPMHEMMKQLDALRREVNELRREVRKIRQD